MSVCVASAESVSLPRAIRASMHQCIERCVQLVLCCGQSAHPAYERRRGVRHPFPYPIHLTPADGNGTPLVDETIRVVGRHLSARGLDFYSHQPLPHRRAIVCFDCGGEQDVRLLMELTWCRFCCQGWYENGGRFLRVIAPGGPMGLWAAAGV